MTTQEEFDSKYITAAEIEGRYGITKSKLSRMRDKLKGEVKIANIYVYERKKAEPIFESHSEDGRLTRWSK